MENTKDGALENAIAREKVGEFRRQERLMRSVRHLRWTEVKARASGATVDLGITPGSSPHIQVNCVQSCLVCVLNLVGSVRGLSCLRLLPGASTYQCLASTNVD